MGFTGSKHILAPRLDLLARDGTVYDLDHATGYQCRPSLQTLATGLDPLQHEALRDSFHALLTLTDSTYARALGPERARRGALFRDHAIQYFQTLPRLLEAAGHAGFRG